MSKLCSCVLYEEEKKNKNNNKKKNVIIIIFLGIIHVKNEKLSASSQTKSMQANAPLNEFRKL